MLTLSRRENESIFLDIGDERIVITLVKIKGEHSARIGIEASESVIISREEISGPHPKEMGK